MWGGRHREGQDSKMPVHIPTEMCNISLPGNAAPLCQVACPEHCTVYQLYQVRPKVKPSLG